MPKVSSTTERQLVDEHIAKFGDFKLPDFLAAAKDPPGTQLLRLEPTRPSHLYRLQQARV